MIFRRPIPIVRPAAAKDRAALSELISLSAHVHRHLDWRPPLDWLDSQPFLVLERDETLLAALACPAEPPQVAWLRLFVVHPRIQPNQAWKVLHAEAVRALPLPRPQICAVALQTWISELLHRQGFIHHQDIVTLEWSCQLKPLHLPEGIHIRPMVYEDLGDVAEIDQSAFEEIWRNRLVDVTRAYYQSAYATVAVDANGAILGFQISTSNGPQAHLARLAARPHCQRRGIGVALVAELQQHFAREGFYIVSVNTQSTNQASLALYQKVGFVQTGERFPVWIDSTPAEETK